MPNEHNEREIEELKERLRRLEGWAGVDPGTWAPGFKPTMFHRILRMYLLRLWPLYAILFLPMLLMPFVDGKSTEATLFGVPLLNASSSPGFLGLTLGIVAVGGGAIGLISFGGLAIGGLAVGGGAVGVISLGGGSFGLLALGGGAFGLVAVGGGAVGYVAVGGGAYGVYVLAGDGKGKYVFDRRRQDEKAVRFFCRYLPRLREAFA